VLEAPDDLPADAARVVDAGLGEANQGAAPSIEEVRRLGCFARAAGGAIVGGAVGRTWGECCELQQLWVDPAHRRAGTGARLLRLFEQRAFERGCRTFYLDTFSFQAPAFYRRLGYAPVLEIAGFTPDIVRYTMMRHVDDSGDLA
jgi:GNAT superfamily N-acetyltransferase